MGETPPLKEFTYGLLVDETNLTALSSGYNPLNSMSPHPMFE